MVYHRLAGELKGDKSVNRKCFPYSLERIGPVSFFPQQIHERGMVFYSVGRDLHNALFADVLF